MTWTLDLMALLLPATLLRGPKRPSIQRQRREPEGGQERGPREFWSLAGTCSGRHRIDSSPRQLDNGPEGATKGPSIWSLCSQPYLTEASQINKADLSLGWQCQVTRPALSLSALVASPLAVPSNWTELIADLPVAPQYPDQWDMLDHGASINCHGTKEGQNLIPNRDLRALRELRVTSGDKIKWVGVELVATWFGLRVDPLRAFFPGDHGRCGTGPFCANCATILKCIASTKDHVTAVSALAPVIRMQSDRTDALRTKRKAIGPPDGA